jgi:hypothetical protein
MAVNNSSNELSSAGVGSLVVLGTEAGSINHRLEGSLAVREYWAWSWVWVWVWLAFLGGLEWPLIRGQPAIVGDGNLRLIAPNNNREVLAHIWDSFPWELEL